MAGTPISSGLVTLGLPELDVTINEVTYTIPYLNVIMLVGDLLEWLGVLPNPFSLLFSLFAGRPKEEATLQQAQRLAHARNPAARLFAIGLQRLVKEFDIVTSTQGSGRAILDLATEQFVENLQAQGISKERAAQILINATSEAAQTGLPLEPELNQPAPANLNFNGDTTTLNAIIKQYENGIASGKTIPNAIKAAEQWVWKNLALRYVFKMRLGTFIPQTPPTTPLIPSPDGKCPEGYALDPTIELCIFTVQPIPPPPPPTPPPAPSPQPGVGPDPDGDEITNTLCAQMQTAAASVVAAVNALGGAPSTGGTGGSGSTSECCANLVAAIDALLAPLATIATNVAAIAAAAATGGGAPTPGGADYTDILTRIATALDTSPGPLDAPPLPAAPVFTPPAPYTPAAAAADIQAAIGSLPNLAPAPNS